MQQETTWSDTMVQDFIQLLNELFHEFQLRLQQNILSIPTTGMENIYKDTLNQANQ